MAQTRQSEETVLTVRQGDDTGRRLLTSARVEGALILLGLAALLFLLPHSIFGDAFDRMRELTLLLGKGVISSRKYSMIGPLFSSPLWLLGNATHSPFGALARYNWTIFALCLGATYWLLRDRVERRLLRVFFLLLIAASMFPNHLRGYYGETFTALLAGMGILLVACGYRVGGWVAVVLGVANTPATLVGMALVVVRRVFERRTPGVLLVLAAAAALIGAENWIRRGSPFQTGYEAGFTYPFFFGLLAILLSFGKGIVFYAPGLLLPVRSAILMLREGKRRELYSAYVMWMCFLAGMVVVYANWWSWSGDWYWGPRFYLFASIPASFAIAVRLRRPSAAFGGNLLTLGALCLSTWVGIDGAVFDLNTLAQACQSNNFAQVYLCQYIPQYSALWRPFVVAEQPTWQSWLFIAYCVLVFAYLVLPLLQTIFRQGLELADSLRRTYLTRAAWRGA
jgi:hypothetical protein